MAVESSRFGAGLGESGGEYLGWGVKLGLFGFVFGFGVGGRKSFHTSELEPLEGRPKHVFWSKLGSFGFVLSRETKCPIGRKLLFDIVLGAFDFLKNWVRFFK